MKKYNMLFKVLCMVIVIISGCVSKNVLDAATFYFATGDLEKVNINSNLIIDGPAKSLKSDFLDVSTL
ncbi:exported hypothetical protein [Candidatus Magnetomoraceae bacterium gMMP-13]